MSVTDEIEFVRRTLSEMGYKQSSFALTNLELVRLHIAAIEEQNEALQNVDELCGNYRDLINDMMDDISNNQKYQKRFEELTK